MSSRNKIRLANALNELQNANLGNLEHDAIGLVEEYFMNSGNHSESESDDSDSESSDSDSDRETELPSADTDPDVPEAEGHDPDLPEDPARPLVVVEIANQADEDGINDGTRELESQRAKARDFDCKCQLFNGGSCSSRYTVDDFFNSQCEMMELTKGEPDLLLPKKTLNLAITVFEIKHSHSVTCS